MRNIQEAESGHTWGPDNPPPVNAEVKPKKVKVTKSKVTKSKAAELKDAIEKGQVGKPDITDKLRAIEPKPASPVSPTKEPKPKKAKVEQIDMVDKKLMKLDQRKLGVLGKAGVRLSKAVRRMEAMTEEKGQAMENMVKAMQQAKRYRYVCAGITFELVHQGPKDTIKVVKPK